MDLPDLPPDVAFSRLAPTPEAIDFAFAVKRAAMGPHIRRRWGWDEAYQRDVHGRRFAERPFHRIDLSGRAVGTISLMALPDHARLGEFYLMPEHQGRGLGSAVLAHCLRLSDGLGLPVRLEHLRWNPVGSLYGRHGFAEVGRTETHCLMERPVGGAPR